VSYASAPHDRDPDDVITRVTHRAPRQSLCARACTFGRFAFAPCVRTRSIAQPCVFTVRLHQLPAHSPRTPVRSVRIASAAPAMPPPRAPEMLLLERLNMHPRDERILFDEATHKYTIDGDRVYTISVSGLVHNYFPHFNAQAVVEKYFKSWNENKASKYFSLIRYLRCVMKLDNDEDIKAEIAASWNAAGTAASGAGTKTHLDIELWLNGDSRCDVNNQDLDQFHAWRSTPPFDSWRVYRTEWSIFDDKACVAGQIDSLWVDPDGKFHMVDWKRSARMEETNSFGEMGFKPFENLHNTNLGHYTVQQNAYAHMLRKFYDIECSSLSLVQIHPSLEKFNIWPLPILKESTADVFSRRYLEVKNNTVVGYVIASEAAAHKALSPEEEAAQEAHRARDMRLLECLLTRANDIEKRWGGTSAGADKTNDDASDASKRART